MFYCGNGGGGPGGGGPGGGDTGGGGTGGGGTGGGSGGTGGGNSGGNTNYWEGKYDGEVKTTPNGSIYTWSSSLKMWTLGDGKGIQISAMTNTGDGVYTMELGTKDSNGAWLATFTLIALAEPTPLGEIALGITLIGVGVYGLYITNQDAVQLEAMCMRYLVRCLTLGISDCRECHVRCKNEGEWPSESWNPCRGVY